MKQQLIRLTKVSSYAFTKTKGAIAFCIVINSQFDAT